jgi:hypothetical protein
MILSWEWLKCKKGRIIATQSEHEPEASGQNCENWTVQFDKLDGPVLSILTVVRGAAGT